MSRDMRIDLPALRSGSYISFMPEIGLNEPVFGVSEVVSQAKDILETTFVSVWIEGEVSNLFKARSGHWYFRLKDNEAALSCVMFARDNWAVSHDVSDGLLVRVRARLSIYEQKGEFQAIVSKLELAGQGALQAALNALVDKLRAEGLFDPQEKRPLPRFPARIAMVTSPQGDAPRDIIAAIGRRFPLASVVLIPTRVQGEGAGEEIVAALERVPKLEPPADLVVVTRGGGSIEDLWTFNLESVARAIFDCEVPVVSAIGHEMDNTVTDLVSDFRAPTPSTAGELIAPDVRELYQGLFGNQELMDASIERLLDRSFTHLNHLTERIPSPQRYLESNAARIDDFTMRMTRVVQERVAGKVLMLRQSLRILTAMGARAVQGAQSRLQAMSARLPHPKRQIARVELRLSEWDSILQRAIVARLREHETRLSHQSRLLELSNPMSRLGKQAQDLKEMQDNLMRLTTLSIGKAETQLRARFRTLKAVSPLATLDRGFAIAAIPDGSEWGRPVSNIEELESGERLSVHVRTGTISTRIESTKKRGNE